jgi:Tfp pilus assembly protein PilZ
MTALNRLSNESTVTARLFELILNMGESEQRTVLKELEKRLEKRKRKHTRKPFFMFVNYASQDLTYNDFIQNISAGGVFIETHIPFSVGQEVLLTFPLPNYLEHIKVAGEVVRTDLQGIGVRFKDVKPDQERRIYSLMEMI